MVCRTLAAAVLATLASARRIDVQVPDLARDGRLVNATVCVADATARREPLLIFSHGWLLAAEDYQYLCEGLAGHGAGAVALIRTALEDPDVQPPLLMPLALDAKLLAARLPRHPSVAGAVSDKVVLGGHSMGGGTSVLAVTLGAQVDALALWAPGLYGNPDADASKVSVPSLVMLGDADCVNVGDVELRGLDTFAKLGSKRKAVVAMKDANHCFWAKPVLGSCAYDACTALSRERQQAAGVRLLQAFLASAFEDGLWDGRFAAHLASGDAADAELHWQFRVTTAASGDVSGKIDYEMCPASCCSDALADMGLCNQTAAVV